jgi:hypothetical protein
LFGFTFSLFCVYRHVVHVDRHPSFRYFFGEDRIHHRLEGCGGVGESKEHDRGFEQAFVSDKGGLPFVSFFDLDIVVSPTDVEFSV